MTPHLIAGPVFSHYGLKNWTMLFLPEEVVCVPHRFWPILQMMLFTSLLMPGRAYAVASQEQARAREEWSTVDSARLPARAWRMPLSTLQRIELRRVVLTASELRIQQAGQGEHIFGIFDPTQLGQYAEALRRAYPRIFFEQ
ncbi:hypothetical protein ATI61_104290 [Archangium gephyra]|uniref:Uncharacterized protein n=1 Tax=Archangium gephyra TaxID=48 RepID=A0AAC8Q3C7_9BACT|nr:hypothetical protein [Archangium gephyra]AKJ00303.1 Hypothetical protein AA314_01929 [Archangium gephyra]REG33000.1 hypothetical protein ATI61_104290 [Archangium gephyra]